MIRVTIHLPGDDHLTYELEHGPNGMLIHSPSPGVVHVKHVRMPVAMIEREPTALGGVRLHVVGDGPIGREPVPRGGKFS